MVTVSHDSFYQLYSDWLSGLSITIMYGIIVYSLLKWTVVLYSKVCLGVLFESCKSPSQKVAYMKSTRLISRIVVLYPTVLRLIGLRIFWLRKANSTSSILNK